MIKQGKIIDILDRVDGVSKAGKEWTKQTFVIETDDQYDNVLAFEVFGTEKVENLTKYNKVGDEVEVDFNIKTNEWNGKYFTSLSAWKISKVKVDEPEPAQNVNKDGDLPF